MTTRTYRCADNVHAHRIGDEAVLLDLARGIYFGLNEVGANAWDALTAGKSVAEVARALATRYDCPEDALEGDIDRLVSDLVTQNLLLELPARR